MASLRSKIPLRIENKPKIQSKIPLKLENKPKVLTISETGLKNSAASRIKAGATVLDKCKPSKKEPKTNNAPLKSKSKENISKVSGKISQNKVPNIGTAKPVTTSKGIKCSKPVSQVLKDRNKKTTQKVPEKFKPVKDKEKEDPLCLFQKEIPEINILDDDPFKINTRKEKKINSHHPSQVQTQRNEITTKEVRNKFKSVKVKDDPFSLVKKKSPEINNLDDDPFKATTKKEKNKNSNHPSQQDIEFVADERMKNLILSNKELTPGTLKACSNRKISSVNERPSMYSRLRISGDPYKQALEDRINYKLADEGRRISKMQKNKLLPSSPFRNERASIYSRLRISVDPYKQALEDIAKFKCATEGQRISEIQSNKLPSSPLVRNSLYKRSLFGDPYEEALKSLAELRIQRKAKTCKKVTFKLSGEGQSSATGTKCATDSKKVVSVIQYKLAEKGENKRSLTPEFEPIALLTPGSNLPKKLTNESPPNSDGDFVNRPIIGTPPPEKVEEKINEYLINNNNLNKNILTSSILKTVVNKEKAHDFSPISWQSQTGGKNAAVFNGGVKNSILKNVNPLLNLGTASEVGQNLFSKQSEHFLDKKNPKIFTPQPVSFYPRTKLSESISPEFLSKKSADILSCAPINTPLVLKSLGRREQSPVCKKLEFKDSPSKETEKEQGDSRENSQTFHLQNIMTQQNILDQLAHQECSIFMHEATFPCEIRNYLQNPIAQILNDGDDTHFVPVRLS